jgi:hypothetical protein
MSTPRHEWDSNSIKFNFLLMQLPYDNDVPTICLAHPV